MSVSLLHIARRTECSGIFLLQISRYFSGNAAVGKRDSGRSGGGKFNIKSNGDSRHKSKRPRVPKIHAKVQKEVEKRESRRVERSRVDAGEEGMNDNFTIHQI